MNQAYFGKKDYLTDPEIIQAEHLDLINSFLLLFG
jgi:hypothetical protein